MKIKRIISLLLCFLLVTQLVTAAVPASTGAGNEGEGTNTDINIDLSDITTETEGFSSITLNAAKASPNLNTTGSNDAYTSSFRFDAELSDVYLENVAEDAVEGAFLGVYNNTNIGEEDKNTYIENALIAYDTNGTLDENIDFEQLPDTSFSIKLSNEFSFIAEEESALENKHILTSQNYNIGWWSIIKEEDGDYILKVTMNKVVYVLQGVSCGFSISVGMRASVEVGKIPQVSFNKDDMELVIVDVDTNSSETPDEQKPAYMIEKTAANTTNSPEIQYTFTVTGEYEADINGTIIKDVIPDGLEVTDVKYAPGSENSSAVQYEVKNNELYITLPTNLSQGSDDKKTMTVSYVATMRLTPEKYKEVLGKGGIDKTISNTATILDKDGNDTLDAADATATTKMKFNTISKEGVQDTTNGTRMNWTLEFNIYGTRLDKGYMADRIDVDKHDYAKVSGDLEKYKKITITNSSGTKDLEVETTAFQEGAQYSSVTVEKLGQMSIEDDKAYVYKYTEHEKEYAIMIIPVENYLNQGDTKIEYSTDLVFEGNGTVDDYLNNPSNSTTVSNDAKFIWKNYYYGAGPEHSIDYVEYTINKNMQVSYSYGTKQSEGSYNETDQTQKWKFTVNHYGGTLPDTIITDTLTDSTQSFLEDILKEDGEIEASYTNRTNPEMSGVKSIKKVESVEAGNALNAPFYLITTQDGTTTLEIHMGDVGPSDYYEFDITTKIKDIHIVGGNVSGSPIANNAKFSISDGKSGRKENVINATATAKNTIITKNAIKFDNGTAYDYTTRELKWRTTVNQNYAPISNGVITDILPAEADSGTIATFGKVTSAKMYKKGDEEPIVGVIEENNIITFAGNVKVATDTTTSTEKVTFTLSVDGNTATECAAKFEFEYTTILKEDYVQDKWFDNSEHDVINTVTLNGTIYGNSITAEARDDATHTIKSEVISKYGKYLKDDGAIEWRLDVNKMGLNIDNAAITDDLTGTVMEFMEDTETQTNVTVKSVTVEADGTLSEYAGEDKTEVDEATKTLAKAINQSMISNSDLKFEVRIPNKLANCTLQITYKTYIVENTKISDVKNEAKISLGGSKNATTGEQHCDSSETFVLDDYATATKNPTILVKKTSSNKDGEDYNIKLGDAKFKVVLMEYSEGSHSWSEGSTKERATKDKTGNAVYLNIKRGQVYKITEEAAPAGYDLDTTVRYVYFEKTAENWENINWEELPNYSEENRQIAALKENKNTVTVHVTDTPLESSKVSFKKVGPENVGIEGATFELTDKDGRVEPKEATSDNSGMVAFENIDPGTYTLTETGAPTYYGVLKNPLTVVVTLENGTYGYTITSEDAGVITGEQGNYQIKDDYMTGSIKVKKVDAVDTNIAISGTTFRIRKKSSQDNVIVDGKELEAITDKNGIATFKNVKYIPNDDEEYEIYEYASAAGYELNSSETISFHMSDVYDAGKTLENNTQVTVAANGTKTFTLDYTAESFENNRITYDLEIVKTENNSASVKYLEGVSFTVTYTNKDAYAPFLEKTGAATDGKSITLTTDAAGKIAVDALKNLPWGNYTISENMPSEGIYKELADVNVTANDVVDIHKDVNTISKTITKAIENTVATGSFSIHKIDSLTMENLDGVVFTLKEKDNATDTGQTQTTKNGGRAIFTNLRADKTYILTETTPVGYLASEITSYEVKLYVGTKNGISKNMISLTPMREKEKGEEVKFEATMEYEIQNTPTSTNNKITIEKTDDEGNPLKGIKFGLYRIVNGIAQDTEAYTDQTNESGQIVFENVAFENYELRETSNPVGYVKANKIIITKEDLAGSITGNNTAFDYVLTGNNTIINTVIRSDVTLVKTVASDSDKKVSGAEFTIYDADGANKDKAVAYLIEDGNTNGKYILSSKKAGASTSSADATKNESNISYLKQVNGKLQLAYGKYYLKETVTPTGYVENTTANEFDVTTKGAIITIKNSGDKYTNARALGKLNLAKKVEVSKTMVNTTDAKTEMAAAGEGFRFRISGKNIWGENIAAEKEIGVTAGTLVKNSDGSITITTNAEGKIELTGLELSDSSGYKVEEIAVTGKTESYVLPQAQTANLTIENNKIADTNLTFENKLKKSDIKGIKVSDSGKPLAGAKLGLFLKGTTEFTQENIFQLKVVTTVEDGTFIFTDVPYGEYIIKELSAPEGHVLGDAEIAVKVDSNGATITKDTSNHDIKFVNVLAKKDLTIVKTDKVTGAKLEGVEFVLTGTDVYGNTVTERKLSTDENGKVTFGNIAAGTYRLEETKQIGYEATAAMELVVEVVDNAPVLKINGTEVTGNYSIENQPIIDENNRISLKKEDQDGQPISGCEFGLFLENNNSDTPSYTATSGTDGKVIFENIPFGNYTLKEIGVPDGYVAAANISITKQQIIKQTHLIATNTSFSYNVGTVKNTIKRGTVSLTKTDASDTRKKLSGAEFVIYSDERCEHPVAELREVGTTGTYVLDNPDNQYSAKNSNGSDILSKTEDSTDITYSIAYGTYYVNEIKAPVGYLKDTAIHQFSISENGQNVKLVNVSGTDNFVNEKGLGTFTITKKIEKEDGTFTTAGVGFAFEITGTSDLGTPIPEGTTATTDENGKAEFTGLEKGTYTVTEVANQVSKPYVLMEEKEVTISINTDTNEVQNAALTVKNELKRSDITGTKVSNTGKKLANAKIGLFKADATEFTDENTFLGNSIATTDSDGKFTFADVPYGEYIITELEAPVGHYLNQVKLYANVTEDGVIVTKDKENRDLTIVDDLGIFDIAITKTDDKTNQTLSGVKFTLSGDDVYGDSYSKDETTDSDGKLKFEEIPVGRYTLSETKQTGYTKMEDVTVEIVLDGNSVKAVITKGDKETTLTGSGDTYNIGNTAIISADNQIKLRKVDQDGNPVKGCTFGLFGPENTTDTPNYTATSEEDGWVIFNGVRYSDYRLKEMSAPAGYVLAPDVNITRAQIAENMTIDSVSYNYDAGMAINVLERGKVSVIKTDKATESRLSGARFEVYTDEACTKLAAKLVEDTVTAGTYVLAAPEAGAKNIVTKNAYGSTILKAETDGTYSIAYGTYYVKEVTAPVGYLKDAKTYSFSITTDGEVKVIENVIGSGYFTNKRGLGTFTLTKEVEKEDGTITAAGAGFAFKVTGTSVLGTVVDTTITTDSTGKAVLANLEKGTYTVEEVANSIAEPYVLAEKQTFEIKINEETNLASNEELTFTNVLKKSDIIGTKVSNTGKTLKDAEIGLFPAGTEAYTEENTFLGMTSTTDINGKFSFEDVSYGEYEIAEIEAPTGHYRSDTVLYVTVAADGAVIVKDINNQGLTIVDHLGTMSFRITKTDEATAQTLKNVAFTLSGTDVYGDVYSKVETTDENGQLTFQAVPVGTYTLSETKQTGYERMEDLSVVISLENGGIKAVITGEEEETTLSTSGDTYRITNTAITSVDNQIKFIKVDQDGNPVRGCTFGLFGPENTTEIPNYTATSGEDGWVIFTGIRYSDYVLKELQAPEGYALSADVIITRAQIAENMTSDSVSYVLELGSQINVLTRGIVSVIKTDTISSVRLSGAEFGVYTDADCSKLAARIVESDKAGTYELTAPEANEANVVTKNTYGSDILKRAADDTYRIAYGSYYVKEITAPTGYLKDEGVYSFTISEDGEKVILVNEETGTNFTNQKGLGTLTLTKKVENADGTITTAGAGFAFRITGTSVLGTEVDTTITTNARGIAILSDIEQGIYTVSEVDNATAAPYVHPLSQEFEITIDTHKNEVVNQIITFTNRLKRSDIVGKKISDDGKDLKDAVMGLYAGDTLFQGKTTTTDENGAFRFCGIPYGEYTIKEISAPEGHILGDAEVIVEVKADGAVISKDIDGKDVTFVNVLARETLTIVKTDEKTEELLPNVGFTLTGTDIYGTEVTLPATTSADGKITFAGLAAGTYILSENKQIGYNAVEDLNVTVTVVDNAATLRVNGTTVTGDYSITNNPVRNEKNSISLVKKDQDGNVISGCMFGLFMKGNTTDTPDYAAITDEKGELTFQNVTFADYTLKEMSVPDGYIKAPDRSITKADIITQCELNVNSTTFAYEVGVVTNTIIRGTMTLDKKDGKTAAPLSGAEFAVYADEICQTQVASLVESNVTGTYVLGNPERLTDKNPYGSVLLAQNASGTWQLAYGTYYVKEVKAPAEYLRDETVYPVIIDIDGETEVLSNSENGFVNNRAEGGLTLTKYKEVAGQTGVAIETGAGITFRVTGVSNLGTTVDTTFTTDENGQFILPSLETGTYKLEEIKTAVNDGYVLEDSFTFDLTLNGEENKVVDTDISLTNKLISADVAGIVITDVGEILTEVTVGIFAAGTTEFTSENVFNDLIIKTDGNGRFFFESVPLGDYVVAQITDAGDYKKITVQLNVSVTGIQEEDKGNLELVFVNTKNDEETTHAVDTTLEIETTTGENKTADESGETGDQAPAAILLAAMCVSAGVILLTAKARKKEQK